MKRITAFLIFLALILPANAVTITFSDLNIQKGTKILVYDYKGNFIGEYNTTDTITLNDSSYVFVLKPLEQSWFSDPWQAIELLKVAAPVMLSYALFVGVIFGLVYILTRVFR